ncbi:GlsB/YeaQ/YmgE family stress response membrane protein [Nocardioides donggukensis]|uniref:GlsB/YeaQ/YmgE family stress response membrane protein n=1 Tax=Nocardioides donggukensis TaxID=2774019 RepID=A0A927Q1L5_9ACTN|nr:GlsB/YeaQ/YmgE family stress response membrane protein [Nocardioides donggukensis]MBD8870242.1 GlsB/YeaQ/YmgE family stress response membrane protein [Nocardioides donggukensis]
MTTSTLLWALAGGALLGLLGKSLAPRDRERVPLWLTTLAGISGVLTGAWLHETLLLEATAETDWWRYVWQIGAGAAFTGVVTTLEIHHWGGRHQHRGHPGGHPPAAGAG